MLRPSLACRTFLREIYQHVNLVSQRAVLHPPALSVTGSEDVLLVRQQSRETSSEEGMALPQLDTRPCWEPAEVTNPASLQTHVAPQHGPQLGERSP